MAEGQRKTNQGGRRPSSSGSGQRIVADMLIKAVACVTEGAGEGQPRNGCGRGSHVRERRRGRFGGAHNERKREVAMSAAPTGAATQAKADGAGDSEAGGVGPVGAPMGPGRAVEREVSAGAM